MNIFLNKDIAEIYDAYYQTKLGKQIDRIEKGIIAELLSTVPKGNLLDIGCGTGHWTEYFIERGFKPTAVDSSESMLEIAKGKKLNADFIQANCVELPFEDASFDCLTSITMLEFVDNQEKAISEMYRVLKKGGHLVIGCLNQDSMLGANAEHDEVFKHAHFFTSESIVEKFKAFKPLKMEQGVYMNTEMEIIVSPSESNPIAPVFYGLLFQKSI